MPRHFLRPSIAQEEFLNTFSTDATIAQIDNLEQTANAPAAVDPSTVVAQVGNVADAAAAAATPEGGADPALGGDPADPSALPADPSADPADPNALPADPAEPTEPSEPADPAADPEMTPEEEEAGKKEHAEDTEAAKPEDALTEEQAQEAYEELVGDIDLIDDCAKTASTIDGIASALDQSAAVGGVRPVDVPAIQVAVESLCEAIGLATPEVLSLGAEHWSPSKRQKNTKMAVEDLREMGVKIWDALIDFLKKLIEWVQNHIRNFIGGTKKIADDIKTLKARLKDFNDVTGPGAGGPATGAAAGPDKFIAPYTVARYLILPGSQKQDVKVSIKQYTSISSAIMASAKKAHNLVYGTVEEALISTDTLQHKANVFTSQNILVSGWFRNDHVQGYIVPEGHECWITPTLPSGIRGMAYIPDHTNKTLFEGITTLGKNSKIVFIKDETLNEEAAKTMPLYTKRTDIEQALDLLQDLNDATIDSLADLATTMQLKRKLMNKLGQEGRQVDPAKLDKNATTRQISGHLIHAISRLYDHPIGKLTTNYEGFANATIRFISASMANGIVSAPSAATA